MRDRKDGACIADGPAKARTRSDEGPCGEEARDVADLYILDIKVAF